MPAVQTNRGVPRAVVPLFGLLALTGCAAEPTPEARLADAAAVVQQVKAHDGCAGPALADAESALEYARFEAKRDGRAFAAEHAELAVEKAERARSACRARP